MAEKIKDFLKFAYNKGKVKDVEEAFKDYPVEEEWHKGKIENILYVKEENEEYNLYNVGDIVFVNNYKYDDGQNNIAVPIENFGMLISSKIDKIKYKTNRLLKKDNNNNLKVDSIVKTDVIYKILDKQILFKIGQVDLDKVEEYKNTFYEINK